MRRTLAEMGLVLLTGAAIGVLVHVGLPWSLRPVEAVAGQASKVEPVEGNVDAAFAKRAGGE